jgi:hypothetical protein
MMVRLGKWAYSSLMTMGLVETAAWSVRRCDSVRCLKRLAMAEDRTIWWSYSSESSSCDALHNPHQISRSLAISSSARTDLSEKEGENPTEEKRNTHLEVASGLEGGQVMDNLEDEGGGVAGQTTAIS